MSKINTENSISLWTERWWPTEDRVRHV